MATKNESDFEKLRTKYESEEHWNLKKEFLLSHKDKFEESRLICLAQVFVNVQLLQCRYPDHVMRQVAELAKGIGVDYKTKQKERLQRTFVNASDAAAAKIKTLNVNYDKTAFEKKSDSDVKNASYFNESKISSDYSHVDCHTVSSHAIKENTKMQRKKEYNKKSDNLEKPRVFEECFDPNDLYMCNIFLILRNFVTYTDYFSILNDCLKFSKINMNTSLRPYKGNDEICEFTAKVKGQMLKLGEAIDTSQRVARENAVKNVVENLLKKCFTIVVKKKTEHEEEIPIDKSNQQNRNGQQNKNVQQKREEICFDSNSYGVKMLKQMGWSGGGLGRNQDGIIEPIHCSKKKAREGIGVKKEKKVKEALKIEVKSTSDEMKSDILGTEKGDVKEAAFTSEISNEQGQSDNIMESISRCSIRANTLELASSSGNLQGVDEVEMKESRCLSTYIGCKDLGVKGQSAKANIFKSKVKDILDEMKSNSIATFDGLVRETVFLSELSKDQKNYIHEIVRKEYKMLKTVSCGNGRNRYVVVIPKITESPQRLICYILSQGGETAKYQVHKPGTLNISSFFPQD